MIKTHHRYKNIPPRAIDHISDNMCNLFDGKDNIMSEQRYIAIKGMSLLDVRWPRATTVLNVIMMVHIERLLWNMSG